MCFLIYLYPSAILRQLSHGACCLLWRLNVGAIRNIERDWTIWEPGLCRCTIPNIPGAASDLTECGVDETPLLDRFMDRRGLCEDDYKFSRFEITPLLYSVDQIFVVYMSFPEVPTNQCCTHGLTFTNGSGLDIRVVPVHC